MNEPWSSLLSANANQTSSTIGAFEAVCYYNDTTYPWSGGDE